MRDVLSNMQAVRNFLASGRSILAKQGELLHGGLEIIESLTETGPLGIAKILHAGFVISYMSERSLARVKGVTRTESFVRNTDPPLTNLPIPAYARAYYPAVCIGIRP